MSTVASALEFLEQQRPESVGWGRPASFSAAVHALILMLLPSLWTLSTMNRPIPVKVLEINVMGRNNLALHGAGDDVGRGPMPLAQLIAKPPKVQGKVVHGNTARVSRSIAERTRVAAAPVPAKLAPRGPLFGSRGGVVEPGVGREKIYAAASAVRLAGGGRRGGTEPGQGLVGVSGAPINLNAKRGAGGNGVGEGSILGGGIGSTTGGQDLERKGESILAQYPSVTQDQIVSQGEKVELPPPPSDGFFTISGPLSRRKIIAMRLPGYPRWAEETGVEALISIRMNVTPGGKVKTDTVVEETSGYPEFDKVALDSVRGIRFAPIDSAGYPRDEWGVATFNFKLKRGNL